MSRRKSIANALAESFKVIDGTNGYTSNIYNNSFSKLKFWDEVSDFPCIYSIAGQETREYHPAEFAWAFLGVSIKVYVKGEDPQDELEDLLGDIEKVINSFRGTLTYDSESGLCTADLSITSITTDEGLLAPYGVGEVNLLVRYQVI